jgi:hypothetical protein
MQEASWERKGGGQREGVEFSFSEEQGAERAHTCIIACTLDRSTQTFSTRFVWSLLLTRVPVSRGLGLGYYCTYFGQLLLGVH